MRELGGAPLDVAAAATSAALALAAVGAVTAALTRRRPVASARESDGDTQVHDAKFDRELRGRGRRDRGVAAANASMARALFFVLLVVAAVSLAVEHLRRRGWGASPFDPTDVLGAISAIEALAAPLARAEVRPHCADLFPLPTLFDAHGHKEGIPPDVHVGGLGLGLDGDTRIDGAQWRMDAARDAEQHFKLGLLLKFGFNPEEARRHFTLAARLVKDKLKRDCAACLWGVAYSLHPDVNNWRTKKKQRAAGRVAAAAAVAVAARDVADARRVSILVGDVNQTGGIDRVQRALKVLVLADAEAAFFGTNVFTHQIGSTDEDPLDVLGDQDQEPAQVDAHVRYAHVLETGINTLARGGGYDFQLAQASSQDLANATADSSRASPDRSTATAVDDPDLLAFLGEALMTLTPWRYWNWSEPVLGNVDVNATDEGVFLPDPMTEAHFVEVAVTRGARSELAFCALRRALQLDNKHPLAAHMMVHLTEALPLRNIPKSIVGKSTADSETEHGTVEDDTKTPKQTINPSLTDGFLRTNPLSPALGTAAADALFREFTDTTLDWKNKHTHGGLSPHLAHMAAHNYARVGNWAGAMDASISATRADNRLVAQCVFPYGEAHNRVMLVFAAVANYGPDSRRGETIATRVAVDAGKRGPTGHLDRFANFLTAFHDAPRILIAARFGRWGTVLKLAASAERDAVNDVDAFTVDEVSRSLLLPDPNDLRSAEKWTNLVSATPFGRLQWAYVMGLAASAGFTDAPRTYEKAKKPNEDDSWIHAAVCSGITAEDWLAHARDLAGAVTMVDFDDVTEVDGVSSRGGKGAFHEHSPFKPVKKRLALIAAHTLGGAVSARKGDWNDAVEQLKKASHVHKTLPYMEPENWYLPVPLCVGEALIRAGRLDEALNVFRSELENARPNDAWARQGERRALKRLETEKDSGAIISDEEKKRATACFEVFP